MAYLEGYQVELDTKTLKAMIGTEISYLLKRDVDRSGRGNFFPQTGTITEVYKRHVVFDDNGDYVSFSQIEEIALALPSITKMEPDQEKAKAAIMFLNAKTEADMMAACAKCIELGLLLDLGRTRTVLGGELRSFELTRVKRHFSILEGLQPTMKMIIKLGLNTLRNGFMQIAKFVGMILRFEDIQIGETVICTRMNNGRYRGERRIRAKRTSTLMFSYAYLRKDLAIDRRADGWSGVWDPRLNIDDTETERWRAANA